MEQCQHIGGASKEIVHRDASDKTYVLCYPTRSESMLDIYLLRKLIEPKQREAGMKYHRAWSRVRKSREVTKAYNPDYASVCEGSLEMIAESERILKEANRALTVTQRNMIIRVCCDNKIAGAADDLETLRHALQRLVKLLKIK